MEKRIVVNRIQTPDGTILCSHHVHDYVEYIDKNGLEYMVDGGRDYLRRTVHKEAPYTEISLYEDSPFEEIREAFCRGGHGKDRQGELKYVPLKDMSDKWLLNTINYVLGHNYGLPLDRIVAWVESNDKWFNAHRYLMTVFIRVHIEDNSIDWGYIPELYIKELEYRDEHNIFIPE